MTTRLSVTPDTQQAVSQAPTLGELVVEYAKGLQHAGVSRPRDEARDIIAAVLDRPRFWPTLHAADRPAGQELRAMRSAVQKRIAGAPFAYAVGKAAFRFLTLAVDERVLIPRPETEQLVELVLASPQARRSGGVAVDVGTGSGAIALALAAEGRFDAVVGSDVSTDALAVARFNGGLVRDSLRSPVSFIAGSGLGTWAAVQARVVVSNPPYIAFGELRELPRSVRDWEPATALSCAGDGLAIIREIVKGATTVLEECGLLALEVDSRRANEAAGIVEAAGSFCDVKVLRDLSGRERFVMAIRGITSDHNQSPNVYCS